MSRRRWSRRRFLRNAALTGAALRHGCGSLPAWATEPGRNDVTGHSSIFFEQPAVEWPDALPVGNGRLGAMIFGRTAHERLQLNEETVWTGERRDRNNPQASRTTEVRALLMAGKVHEAEALADQVMMGVPVRLPVYQTLGDFWLDFEGVPANVTDYRLELDLDDAVVKMRFAAGDLFWTREVFSSAPRNAIVVRLESNQPMSLAVRLDRVGAQPDPSRGQRPAGDDRGGASGSAHHRSGYAGTAGWHRLPRRAEGYGAGRRGAGAGECAAH